MKYLLLLITFFIISCDLERTNLWDPTNPVDKPKTLPDSIRCKVSTAKTTIAWGDAEFEKSYIVEKKIGNGNWQQVAELPKDSKTYSESGINYNSEITYRVKSYNSDKDQQYSDYQYFNFYTVSGKITKPDGLPFANAAIFGLPYALSTDANGNYCALLPKCWSGSLVVDGDFIVSGQISMVTSSVTQNFTTVAALTISGKVATSNSVGIAGVVLNGFPFTVTTNVNGNYTTIVAYGWSGTVTPFKAGYLFPGQGYSNITTDQLNQNYTAVVQISGFAFVSGGTFNMGDASIASPVHSVTLTSFYIGKYEVTQTEWLAVMGTNPSSFTGDLNRPVENVSWYDIMVFCNKKSVLNGLTPCYTISGSTNPTVWGIVPTSANATWNAAICNWSANGYRLPTEAEWEFAARGGNSSQGYTYSGSSTIGDVAWYSNNSGSTTHHVGTKSLNELGIYDMSGNVWEWNWDWHASYTAATQTNTTGAATGSYRIFRGGGCSNAASRCLVAFRNSCYPYDSSIIIGFRLVCSF